MNRSAQSGSRQGRALNPAPRQPEPPFPLQSGVIDNRLSRSGGMGRPAGGVTGAAMARQGFASGDEAGPPGASAMGGGDPAQDTSWFSSANPPRAPSGLSTGLQPGGLAPGGGPAASTGSIGTGGAQTGGQDTGSLKRDGR